MSAAEQPTLMSLTNEMRNIGGASSRSLKEILADLKRVQGVTSAAPPAPASAAPSVDPATKAAVDKVLSAWGTANSRGSGQRVIRDFSNAADTVPVDPSNASDEQRLGYAMDILKGFSEATPFFSDKAYKDWMPSLVPFIETYKPAQETFPIWKSTADFMTTRYGGGPDDAYTYEEPAGVNYAQWEGIAEQLGYKGPIYGTVGYDSEGGGITGIDPQFKSFVDQKRAEGYDFVQYQPDLRNYRQQYGFKLPSGEVVGKHYGEGRDADVVSLFKDFVLPVGTAILGLPGFGSSITQSIGSSILPAQAATAIGSALNLAPEVLAGALGRGVINAGIQAALGEDASDVLRAGVLPIAAPAVSNLIGQAVGAIAPPDFDPVLGQAAQPITDAVQKAITAGAVTGISGGDASDVLRAGVSSIAPPIVSNLVGQGLEALMPADIGVVAGPLADAAQSALTRGALAGISGGDVSDVIEQSLLGSAAQAVGAEFGLSPKTSQELLNIARSDGNINPVSLYRTAVGASNEIDASRRDALIAEAYNDPSRRQDVVDPNDSSRADDSVAGTDVGAELDRILGGGSTSIPTGDSTLIAGPADFSAPDKSAQKAQIAEYIRQQAQLPGSQFEVLSNGVLKVSDYQGGAAHFFTSDGTPIGSQPVTFVIASRTGREIPVDSSGRYINSPAVEQFMSGPLLSGMLQDQSELGGAAPPSGYDATRVLKSEVDDPDSWLRPQPVTDEVLPISQEELEEELQRDAEERLMEDAGVQPGDYGQGVFDEIDRTLAQQDLLPDGLGTIGGGGAPGLFTGPIQLEQTLPSTSGSTAGAEAATAGSGASVAPPATGGGSAVSRLPTVSEMFASGMTEAEVIAELRVRAGLPAQGSGAGAATGAESGAGTGAGAGANTVAEAGAGAGAAGQEAAGAAVQDDGASSTEAEMGITDQFGGGVGAGTAAGVGAEAGAGAGTGAGVAADATTGTGAATGAGTTTGSGVDTGTGAGTEAGAGAGAGVTTDATVDAGTVAGTGAAAGTGAGVGAGTSVDAGVGASSGSGAGVGTGSGADAAAGSGDGLTQEEIQQALAGLGLATQEDVSRAIAGIQMPQGINRDDVTKAISDYMAANPGLSATDVATQVSEQLAKLPTYATPTDVTSAVNAALAGVATQADVNAAIAGIQFPQGITSADVTKAISDYMAVNPGLSAQDVAKQVGDALSGLPTYATPSDVQAAVQGALAGYATSADVAGLGQTTQTAITGVEDRLNTRVDELMRQGADYQTATNQALAEVTGSLTSISEQQAATEAARQADEAARREAEAARQEEARRLALQQQQESQRQQMLSLGASLQGKGASTAMDPYKATFLAPFIVGGEAPKGFTSPLAGFLKGATTQGFLPEAPQRARAEASEQPVEFFDGSTMIAQNPLEVYNPEEEFQGLFGFRQGGIVPMMAQGGTRYGHNAHGGLRVLEHSGKRRVDYRQGDAVTGVGDGQSDDIPAMLADGEFVIPADVVSALGNGSTKAGSDKLYDMMHSIRRHHRSAGPKDLPPPAKKSPLDYITKRRSSR